MKRSSSISWLLLKALLEKLRDADTRSVLGLSLTKGDLLSLTQWELEFVKEHVGGYLRGKAHLRPKSFEDFLSNRRYEASCEVGAYVPVEDLMKAGLLRVESVGGKLRWVLGDVVLNPAEYRRLYASTKETLLELADALNVLNLFTAFIEVPDNPDGKTEYEFNHGGMSFVLYLRDPPYLTGRLRIRKTIDNTTVDVSTWVYVDRPTLRDVSEVVSLAGTDVVLHALDVARFVATTIEKQTGDKVASVSSRLSVSLSNYRASDYDLYVDLDFEAGGGYTVRYQALKYDNAVEYTATVSRTVPSHLLASTLSLLHEEFEEMKHEVDGVEVKIRTTSYGVTVEATVTDKGEHAGLLPTLKVPDVSKLANILRDPASLVCSYILKRADDLRNGRIAKKSRMLVYSSYRGDIVPFHEVRMEELNDTWALEVFKWGTETSRDEILLKLALLSTVSNKTLMHVLATQLYADGVLDEDEVHTAIKKPLDVIVELVQSGRLRVSGGKLYLDGVEVEVPEKYWSDLVVVADLLTTRPPAPVQRAGTRVRA